MTLETAVGIAVFAAVMGIWGGAAVSRFIEHDSGAETAERFNIPILAAIVFLVLLSLVGSFLFSLLNISILESASLLFILIHLIIAGLIGGGLIFIIWKRRQLPAGSLLLDAGRNIIPIRLLISGYFILTMGCGSAVNLFKGEQPLELNQTEFAQVVLIGVLLSALIISSCAKVYFTEEGISLFRLTTIKWERIRDFVWGFRNPNKVILILRGGSRVEFTISGNCKEQGENILQARVKEKGNQPVDGKVL
jgi:hypothetical protein